MKTVFSSLKTLWAGLRRALFDAGIDRAFDEGVNMVTGQTGSSETGHGRDRDHNKKTESRGAKGLRDEIFTEEAKALAQNAKVAQDLGFPPATSRQIRLLDEVMSELSIAERDKVTNFFGNHIEKMKFFSLNADRNCKLPRYDEVDWNIKGTFLILSIIRRSKVSPHDDFTFKMRIKNCLLADGALDTLGNRIKQELDEAAGGIMKVIETIDPANVQKAKNKIKDWRKRAREFNLTA